MNTKNLLKGALLSGLLLVAGLLAFNAISTDEIADNSAVVLTADMNGIDNFVPVTNEKCGDDKAKEGDKADADSTKAGKCGEGKCGDDKAKSSDKADADSTKEGKCGEGKCGDDKAKSDDKAKEGKCGEGKCGEGKCG